MRKNLRYLFLWLTLIYSGITIAQDGTITGEVRDKNSGETLPGANVVVVGTSFGSMTDINGKFSIEKIPFGEVVLKASFIGYITQNVTLTVAPGKITSHSFNLAPDVAMLDELVVVGYGVQKKSLLTSSISKVTSDDIEKSKPLRLEQALQGKTAGVQVIANSGQPGDGFTVRIRGAGTTGSADPVYIVDGMPAGGLDFINPGDIESMEVLKDASATAIYGARGANGVVLITTKQGKKGKLNVGYDFSTGIQNPWKQVSLLNASQYVKIMNESYANDGSPIPFPLPGPLLDTVGNGTDWQKELFYKNAPIQNHQFTVSGGNDVSTFYTSFAYTTQDGIVAKGKSNYERFSYRINSEHHIGKFSFGNNLAFIKKKTRGIDPNAEFGGPLAKAVNIDPLTPVINPDGTWGQSLYATQEVVNPVAYVSILNTENEENKIAGDVWGQLEIVKGLKVKSAFGIEVANGFWRSFVPIYDLGGNVKTSVSEASSGYDRWFTWQSENTLSYTNKIDDHSFTALVGMTANSHRHDWVGGRKSNLLFDDYEHAYIDNGTDEDSYRSWGSAFEHSLLSYFARGNYSYKDKYMFEAVIRADGSSNFGINNRFGYFPAVSAGWVLTRESFMESIPAISFLKLRLGWGQNGNESIGSFKYTSVIGSGSKYTFGTGEVINVGSNPVGVSNPDLRWETSEQTNLGIDSRFFNDKLTAGINLYRKDTKDLLVVAPIPAYVGNGAPTVNGGSVRNTGVELELGYKTLFRDISFDVNLNGGYNKNEVTEINNSEGKIYGAGVAVGMYNVCMAEVGQPIAFFWGYRTAGIFQNEAEIQAYVNSGDTLLQPNAKPGDLIWVDVNKDGKIDDKDRTNIGNPYPDFTIGLSLGAEYKGFDFNMFWYGAFGQEIYAGTRRYDLPMSNWDESVMDRWTASSPSNTHPRVTIADPNQNYFRVSDYYIHDGSFLRLKNLTIGYTIPKTLSQKLSVSKLRVYLSASNLLTFTKYKGFDPEIGAKWALDVGIDRNIYPQSRTFIVGVNLNF